MDEVIIVGIGNPYRGDDAAGWAVVDALSDKIHHSITLDKQRGGIAELLDVFSRYPRVYLIDACLSDSSTKRWRRIDVHQEPLPEENAQTSTHGLSVSQAIELAKNLDLLPSKLIVYAITGEHFNMSDTLSSTAAQAVDEVVKELLKEEEMTHA